ncbi:MAG: TonB C-terminal domain-containing protein [Acidobacteriota bacterium]|nr:MAG: TonB C-terminal domain-containing protein [Acidobacteriota bacterium]
MKGILHPHIDEGRYRNSVIASVVTHTAIVLVFTFGLGFFPSAQPLTIGLGEGGGSGDYVSVGLSAEAGGGEGMYKAPITPRAETAPVVEEEEAPPPEPEPEQQVFTQVEKKKEPKPAQPYRERPREETKKEAQPGQIARTPDPGKGSRSGGGSGGGIGSGQGVKIGSGSGDEGAIQSWYIRQVEQRVGQNWLQTSLGQLDKRVSAVASFVVEPSGRISEIGLDQSSGIRSVDLAVQRAIQASNPLPRLPYELRGRRVKFQAVFEYPPR